MGAVSDDEGVIVEPLRHIVMGGDLPTAWARSDSVATSALLFTSTKDAQTARPAARTGGAHPYRHDDIGKGMCIEGRIASASTLIPVLAYSLLTTGRHTRGTERHQTTWNDTEKRLPYVARATLGSGGREAVGVRVSPLAPP